MVLDQFWSNCDEVLDELQRFEREENAYVRNKIRRRRRTWRKVNAQETY